MRFPYVLVANSPLPRLFGFRAQTVLWFILNEDADITPQDFAPHELNHVAWFWTLWAAGVAFVLAFLPLWALALTPLTYSLGYVVAGLYARLRGGSFYVDNIFERMARHAAGEHHHD